MAGRKVLKDGVEYEILSDGTEDFLNTFSGAGSLHYFLIDVDVLEVEMLFKGGAADENGRYARYAGPVVIYREVDAAKAFLCPKFEFEGFLPL